MGGGQQFNTGTNRDANSPIIPHISNGTDMQAFFELLMPHFIESLEGLQEGQPPKEFDKDKINSELAILPDKPDEILR